MAVTGTGGTYTSTNGKSWTEQIATAPGSNFADCTIFNSVLLQTSSTNANVSYKDLSGVGLPAPNGTSGPLQVTTYSDGSPKGAVPQYCGLIHAHGGAVYMAGDVNNPQVLYRCAINDVTDWDTSATDEGAAWASSGVSGQINKPIVGLLTHGNGCLLVGHVDAITAVRGDPQIGGGGSIDELVQFSGPIMQSAWCKTGSDETVMLTREDLTIMAPGCGAPPVTVSRYKLPSELTAIDPTTDTASVCYDGRYNAVFIYITRGGSPDAYSQFYFDLGSKGFFPMSFTSGDYRLGVTTPVLISDETSGSIALKSGGGIYYDTDSTESIASHVYIGPIHMGGANQDGILESIAAVLAEDSGPVNFSIASGESAQEAFYRIENAGDGVYSGTWRRQGLNYSSHPRVRGNVCYVKLYATGTTRWNLERLLGAANAVSRRRVMRNAP